MSVHGPLGATDSGAFELRAPARDARVRSSVERTGLLALGGVFVTCLLVAISAAGTDALLPATIRPIPPWLAGPFGSTGINVGTGGVIVVLGMMFVSYWFAVRAADRLNPRLLLMCVAALAALMLLAPPLFSTDVFSYEAYARMGEVYSTNPYLQGPHAIALDPVYPFIGAKWVTTPSAYGPLFTVIGYLLAPLSIAAGVLAYKAIAAIACLLTVALVWNAARLRGIDPRRSAALVGLNPLIVVYGVGGGHNDLLMLLALVAGLSLILQQRDRMGTGLMAVSAGVKLTAAFFVPFAIAGAKGKRRRDLVVGAVAGAGVVAALGFAVFGSGPIHLLGTVSKGQSEGDWHSIPGFISNGLGFGGLGHVVLVLLAIVFVVTFCWLLREVWRGQLDWIDGASWAALALLITAGSMLPWYAAWLMPMAALARDRRLWRSTMVLTAVVLMINVASS